jgi:ferredoxin
MSDDVYARMAEALDRLPNGFPRTESGVELAILKKIFTAEEAEIASQLGREWAPFTVIVERVGMPAEEAKATLIALAKRGVLRSDQREGTLRFRLRPWIVGIYEEYGLEAMDHEFAHLVEAYFAEGGAEGIMRPQPALHRVIPAQKAVKSEWILPYDDVKAVLEASTSFGVRPCICRVQQDYIGRRCAFPLDICVNFSSRERPPRPGDISKEEAIALLEKAEAIGLVHTVSNVMEGFGYVCNCCACCCGILRGITDFGIENSVAYANYYSTIDADACTGCGVCVTRCQVKAISLGDGIAVVNREQCIGCGLCFTGCPTEAARLQLKPKDAIVHPPKDFGTWEDERLVNRGKR